MGWSSAGPEIFDPVAQQVVQEVDHQYMSAAAAKRVLTELIERLLDRDWDTARESMGLFRDKGYIVHAFMDCDIVDEDC